MTMSHPVALADVTQHLTPAEHTAGALLNAKAAALAASIAEHGFALLTGEVIPGFTTSTTLTSQLATNMQRVCSTVNL